VYSSSQLAKILNEQSAFWRLADRTTAGEFIAFLEKQGKLKSHRFKAEKYQRNILRYSLGDVSIYELTQSLHVR
ncbi:hypothetical protein, partial [Streptococcus pneumoniae]|uniref:hypothetical protein n=1 Tax=Streptococcus pneumoniae TaxID=1313 RepID=UPI0019548798